LLIIEDLSSGYEGTEVLHSININISNPGVCVVLGPNGAGKTTLFRTIAGVLRPYTGAILFKGMNTYYSNNVRKDIGYLSHFTSLPEEMTVKQALDFYASIEEGDSEFAISKLGLEHLKGSKISKLSQGLKKLVSVAKIFLRDRSLYLLDEPTSNLDPSYSMMIRDLMLNLSHRKIILYSSHNLYEASSIGDYVIVIKEGRLVFFGKRDELKVSTFRIGIESNGDLRNLLLKGSYDKGYFIVSVNGKEEVSEIIRKIIDSGMKIYEVRELDNPLEEVFRGE
jgi:ABC-2 type transport system ATP-binding protein